MRAWEIKLPAVWHWPRWEHFVVGEHADRTLTYDDVRPSREQLHDQAMSDLEEIIHAR